MDKNKIILQASAVEQTSGQEYHFLLEYYVFMQDGSYIAYCPSLDLSTSADNFNEAISNFYEAFQLYVETCVEYGTLQQDLELHGWKILKAGVRPPKTTTVLRKPEMKSLLDSNTSYERIVTPARIPAFV